MVNAEKGVRKQSGGDANFLLPNF